MVVARGKGGEGEATVSGYRLPSISSGDLYMW